jgi:tetratricopeptide (TPR) repeat protein
MAAIFFLLFGQRMLILSKTASMNFRILYFVPLLGALLLSACGPTSRTDALLDDVESYLDVRPDSARAVLELLDTTDLLTRRQRARYSFLRTVATDRSGGDIRIPGLFDDALAWYSRHGSPDEKLNAWYYQGRIRFADYQYNAAAIAYAQAEAYADEVQDLHAVGRLYVAFASVYGMVSNFARQREYAEKAYETFKRADDPYTLPSLGVLAMACHRLERWDEADSLFREAIPSVDTISSALPLYLYDYARMKLEQPVRDPEGALALLARYRDAGGYFGVDEAGAYAYALELSGNRAAADPVVERLRTVEGEERFAALVWLSRIDAQRGDYDKALKEYTESYTIDKANIVSNLEDSVMQSLREEADRKAKAAREHLRSICLLVGGVFFALLSLVLLLMMRKDKLKAERDRLIDLREQMQNELERVQEENTEKAELLSGQEDRIREMEANVAREREIYTRERVKRLRQLGELRSTFWWRERGGMRESDAIQQIKKEISYVYQTDNDGVALIRRLDAELDGAVSQLRKGLHLRGKPQEVLFLCCCILDLEPEMIAEIMGTSKANVYVKRFRLRARVRELNDPLLSALVEN